MTAAILGGVDGVDRLLIVASKKNVLFIFESPAISSEFVPVHSFPLVNEFDSFCCGSHEFIAWNKTSKACSGMLSRSFDASTLPWTCDILAIPLIHL
ncbi:hypothetical protein SO802_029673 [Lithocarpus litseifolius]|uniref:Uncharacterized protein n=1 Tax=Lithocarpus litseifolius TaxID=425828 RepID=A0AAW2BXB1_9ROSI